MRHFALALISAALLAAEAMRAENDVGAGVSSRILVVANAERVDAGIRAAKVSRNRVSRRFEVLHGKRPEHVHLQIIYPNVDDRILIPATTSE